MAGPELSQYWNANKQDGRRYKHPHTGEYVPSVTTITGLEDKPNLIQWAADLTLRWSVANWNLLGSKGDREGFNAGRYRWRDERDERALIGTEAHEWIEADMLDSWAYPELGEEAAQIIEQYQDLRNTHELVGQDIERTAWNHTDGWAGTLDFGGTVDGVPTLGDWKTSKGLWDAHRMQLAALSKAEVYMVKHEDGTWTEEEPPQYEQFAFFHLRPDYYDPMKEELIPAFWEIEFLDPDEIDPLYEQFLGYRRVKAGQDALKAVRKEKENLAKEVEKTLDSW